MQGIDDFHREISARGYRNYRPGIEEPPWNARVMEVIDPFGNHIRFSQFHRTEEGARETAAGGA